jgi:hypothetical protein
LLHHLQKIRYFLKGIAHINKFDNFAFKTALISIMRKPYLFLLITLCFLLTGVNRLFAQKWQPGYFYDVKGNKETGLIKTKNSGRAPVKDEAFITFKENEKANEIKISASELRAYIVGQDSFIVAVAPRSGAWSQNELDFVKVVIDEPLKLYAFTGRSGGGGAQSGLGIGIGGGVGGGGGGFGYGLGGGFTIPLGGGGGHLKTTYYFGANTAEMQELTPVNFVDAMTEIMGDEPDVVDKIKDNEYNLGNIDQLITYFNKVEAADTRPPAAN